MEPAKDQVDANPPVCSQKEGVNENFEALKKNGSGDNTDAFPYRLPGGSNGEKGEMKSEPMDMSKMDVELDAAYNMNHPKRGYALVINNREFDRKTGMGSRNGTDIDAANLYQIFKRFGFDAKLTNNLTVSKMLVEVQNFARMDHSKSDCFVLCILSHGDEGVVYGTDGILPLDIVTAPFKGTKCPSLIGKPKLFFIQACRGSQLDHGVVEADSDDPDALPKGRRIPQEADVLMAFSTVPGYYSWRNSTKGSWFVQAICQVMSKYGETHEIMDILTRVNYKVAYEFESSASSPAMSQKKQIPCIMSMLTRKLYFHPKK